MTSKKHEKENEEVFKESLFYGLIKFQDHSSEIRRLISIKCD
jgi:hypothetical protein